MTVESAPFRLEEEAGVDGFLDFAARLFERLANFASFKGHKRVLVLHQKATHVADDLATGGRWRGGPCRERSVSSMEGGVDVVSGGEREFAKAVGQMSGVG